MPLPHWHAVVGDPSAHTELDVAVRDRETQDDHVEIRTGDRAHQDDSTRVRAARFGLKIGNSLLGVYLGCTCHRSWRKDSSEQLPNGRLRFKLTADRRDQVPNARMRL